MKIEGIWLNCGIFQTIKLLTKRNQEHKRDIKIKYWECKYCGNHHNVEIK